jgi:hypothetical protein
MQKNTAKMRTAGANTVSSGQNCLSMIMHKNGSLLHRMHELLKKENVTVVSVHHFRQNNCWRYTPLLLCARTRFEQKHKVHFAASFDPCVATRGFIFHKF